MAALGLGLAALGRPGYMTLKHAEDFSSIEPSAMEAQAHAVLDAAYAGGIRHIDVARSYGRAEFFLHSWLETRGHRDLVISSKWGYRYAANWASTAPVHEIKELTLAHFKTQWAETHALLGKHLSIYQVHSVTPESGVLVDTALLDALAELRNDGVAVGLSVTGPHQSRAIDDAIAIERDGKCLFEWVQATWNVLEPSAGPALTRAKDRGLRTIAKEGLANGLLSSRGQVTKWLSLTRGASPDAVALCIALQQPFLDVVLSGASTVSQLHSNLLARTLGPVTFDWLSLTQSPETYWAQRAQLAWT